MTNRWRSFVAVAALATLPLTTASAASDTNAVTGGIQGRIRGDGSPVSGAIVVSCTGTLTRTGPTGEFSIDGLSQAAYSVQVLAPGWETARLGNIEVKPGETTAVAVGLEPAPAGSAILLGKVVDADTGDLLPATLQVEDREGNPIRWFDVDGNPYGGRTDIEKGWHVKTRKAWTQGDFAFAVPAGKVTIRVSRPGYLGESLALDVTGSGITEQTIQLKRFADMKTLGWYAGDFHAHCVHGEKFYKVNVPFAAAVLRAEGYDWFYLSSSHAGDGVAADYQRIAREQSGPDLFLRLNTEFPKTRLGHIGNVGAPVVARSAYKDIDRYTNVELIREFIVRRGGLAAAVHPVYRNPREDKPTGRPYFWMQYSELPFLTAAAPNLLTGLDIYYPAQSYDEAYDLWFLLLNRGHRLCGTASSDAAFDIGHTPGNASKTYLYLGDREPSEESIKGAFAAGRTFLSSGGALLDFRIGNDVSGAVLPADGTERQAALTAYCPAGRSIVLELIRNGDVYLSFPVAKTVEGASRWTVPVKESEDAWYVARLVSPSSKRWCACASPIYFSTGRRAPLEGVIANVKGTIVDGASGKPVEGATLDVVDYKTIAVSQLVGSEFTVSVRPYHRFRVRAPGYRDRELSIALDHKPIRSAIHYLTKEQMHDPKTYDAMRAMLRSIEFTIELMPR